MDINQFIQHIKDTVGSYQKQVEANKQQPFFNAQNTPTDWLFNKVPADIKKRGIIEGMHDLSYGVLENPYIEPISENVIGGLRVNVSKIPNQNATTQLLRKLLGLPPTVNTLP